tara:strand:- start:916 stop:1458 length:543 start_codon:yes stop_codon:yes gene_type:complete
MFKEKTQVVGLGFLLFIQFSFMLYMYVVIFKTTKFYKIPLYFLGYLSLGSILIGSVLNTVALIMIGMVLYNLNQTFFKIQNKPLDLSKNANKRLKEFKDFFVSYFCLNSVIMVGVVLFFPFINKGIDIRDITNPETIILILFMFICLAVLGMSGYQIFIADELLKYSRKQIVHQENDKLS